MTKLMENDGKFSEGKVTEALKRMEEKYKATYVRLYDSTSAGGSHIHGQPGDFILAVKGTPVLLEVKSSIKRSCLSSCTLRHAFSKGQILGARLWARAGASALCVFHHVHYDFMEIWSMQPVIEAYLAPPRSRELQGSPLLVCNHNKERLADGFIEAVNIWRKEYANNQ